MDGSGISYGHRHLSYSGYPALSLEYYTTTCCRSNPLPYGWNCHNMGILLSKNYCSRIIARTI
ncbi:hypothetical protein IEQ34_003031 [Dendrobium chrysotoxum]|uniref:Uncharacterized protein n=1 Tax=Dendrobium chrysotoxum TaxID=161865 RepID=A0AAV7HIU6_DENCH|nr:hypothetical protein IEQ34_003031 [Dendrobium chrysotoxum]